MEGEGVEGGMGCCGKDDRCGDMTTIISAISSSNKSKEVCGELMSI